MGAALDFGTFNGQVGGLSNQLSENVGNVPGNLYNVDANLDFRKQFSTVNFTDLEARFNIAALVNDESLSMFSLKEAYIGKRFTNKDYFRIGRQVLDWSPIDSTWGFGKLNNRVNFDFFNPDQEGLIGLLYERKSTNHMRYQVFGSVLYVPELNPALDVNDRRKTIKSRHPWADAPATTADVQGSQKSIEYTVEMPKSSEVVRRASFGGNIGWDSKHWVFDNFFMRKPENQISQKVGVQFNSITDRIEAQVKPQFYYHDVLGSSFRYRNADVELYVSGIMVKPNTFPDVNNDAVLQTEIKSKKYREDYLGGGISRINDLYGMGFSYVARLSNYDRDKETLSLDPRWNQAINIFLSRRLFQRLNLSTDLKYDMLTTDRLIMLRASFAATKEFMMNLGVNMIGTPNDGKSFWSPYTNNDALYAGLRYIF